MTQPLAALQRVRGARTVGAQRDVERCDLCADLLPASHGHLVDLGSRDLRCLCRACALLFGAEGAGGGHLRMVPDRYRRLGDVALSPAQWDALQIPVGIAFFFRNSALGRVVAFYPGPAGATESELSIEAWAAVEAANPSLADIEPDVEAILVRSEPRSSEVECFLVPIDACYELVGRLRRSWRGFDGGREAQRELEQFFSGVRERAR